MNKKGPAIAGLFLFTCSVCAKGKTFPQMAGQSTFAVGPLYGHQECLVVLLVGAQAPNQQSKPTKPNK